MIIFHSEELENRTKALEDLVGNRAKVVYDWSSMYATGRVYARGLCKRVEELETEIKELRKRGKK